MHCVSTAANNMFVTRICVPTRERGNEELFGVYAYLFFAVILCTPQGGIELNVSGVSQARLPAAKKSSFPPPIINNRIYLRISLMRSRFLRIGQSAAIHSKYSSPWF